MAWNTDLTHEQIDAASFFGSHARLLAGPGTGKTLALTRRVLFLITEKNVDPSKITILTFTRAAAAELRNRIKNELSEESSIPNISTIHSFALKMLLKNEAARSRLQQPLFIANDYEEKNIIKQEMKSILGLNYIKDVTELFNQLSADWETLSADLNDWESRFPNPTFLGAWKEHRKVYGYILRSELVYQLKKALEEGDMELNSSMEYLLVDEYQDLNACDLAIVNSLTQYGAELFCAGDDDQSIYGFRYANPEGIRRFNEDYTPSESLELSTCMRCDRKILDFSLYIAKQDPRRIEKNLLCKSNADEGEVKILRFRGPRHEADGIAQICSVLIQKGIDPSKILILLRSDRNRNFSKVLNKSLVDKGVPVSLLSNPFEALETDEASYLISLLRIISKKEDNLAWRTILKVRQNNIGTTKINKIYELALREGWEFYQAIYELKEQPELISNYGNEIRNEIIEIETIVDNLDYDDSTESLFNLIQDLSEKLITDKDNRNDVMEILTKVILSNGKMDLKKFVNSLNISISDKEGDLDENSVSIMTMHQAKGLTADVVFVVAAEQEYIPGIATTEAEKGDLRRLLYVSLTRAKHYLYITHCQKRTGPQQHSGSNTHTPIRHLSEFLSGGPVKSMAADVFLRNFK